MLTVEQKSVLAAIGIVCVSLGSIVGLQWKRIQELETALCSAKTKNETLMRYTRKALDTMNKEQLTAILKVIDNDLKFESIVKEL